MTTKYPRTFHLPYSPGATRDDRIQHDVSALIGTKIVILEKMDGSNVSLSDEGVFARSHSGPPTHPSFNALKAIHASLTHPLFDIEIFGEWCYAKHSIHYTELPAYFMSFGARHNGDGRTLETYWMPWDDEDGCSVVKQTEGYGLCTVPVLYTGTVTSEAELKTLVQGFASQDSACGGEREGVVVRAYEGFAEEDFSKNVLKYVREGHVTSSTHWKHQEIVKNGLK